MLKVMLKPFFKRYIGLFISMVFVSSLAISLLCTFGSTIVNLNTTYKSYLNTYGDVDEQISTQFTRRSDVTSYISSVEGVEAADARVTLDAFLQKPDGRTIVSRIFSFNEKENKVFKRFVVEKIEKSNDFVNISICSKFAKNNGIKLGDKIKLGYFNMFIEFYVNEIIETSEGIYPRANDYIWSDNQDFGYLYVDEYELNEVVAELARLVKNELETNPEYKTYYEQVINMAGILMPDLRNIENNFVSTFTNQILVRNKDGFNQQAVMDSITSKLNEHNVEVKSSTIGENLPYKIYMNNAIKQLTVASIFLPVFFYSVTMVVIGLFMNQIIKHMTSQIGIMMSVGIDKKEIIMLFMVFGFLMSICAGIIGSGIGYALNILMTNILRTTYSLPTIPYNLYWLVVFGAIVGLVIFALITTFLSCLAIFKITPKDAVISNEAKRKNLPKWLNRVIDKAPMNIKLGMNSIAQNPKRFFVSVFAMLASLVIILLSLFFYIAKEEMIAQSVERRLTFDCQVYLMNKATDEQINELKSQTFISEFEDGYYTYLKAEKDGKTFYLESVAVDPNAGKLINIPDSSGSGALKVKEEGIIIPDSIASANNIRAGDTITIGGKNVIITDISKQYFHPMTYMSKAQMNKISNLSVSTYFINVKDEGEFLTYMSENNNQCLTVFTRSLSADLHAIFNSVNVFIYIMIGFSLGMSFIILAIMSQNALMEQQRPLSVMRAIGFTILDISNFWTLQSVLQLLISSIFAIPLGIVSAIILFNLCSSPNQIYPFIPHAGVIFIALGFVLLVVIATHLFAMYKIRRWNIADNTRCRE